MNSRITFPRAPVFGAGSESTRSETEQNDRTQDRRSTEREGHRHVAAIDSRNLFGSAETLHIEHQGLTYILRKTRNGKLILTK